MAAEELGRGVVEEVGAEVEGLLQHRGAAVGFDQAGLAVAGGEGEGDAAGLQLVGDGEDLAAADVDVEDGGVELGVVGQAHGLVEVGGGADNVAAELRQHVLDQHGDEHLVFHDQHTKAVETCDAIDHQCEPLRPKPGA